MPAQNNAMPLSNSLARLDLAHAALTAADRGPHGACIEVRLTGYVITVFDMGRLHDALAAREAACDQVSKKGGNAAKRKKKP